jgi:hypothetical protein
MQITPGVKTSLNYHVNHSAHMYEKYQHARTRRELQVLPFITTGTSPLIFLPRARLASRQMRNQSTLAVWGSAGLLMFTRRVQQAYLV